MEYRTPDVNWYNDGWEKEEVPKNQDSMQKNGDDVECKKKERDDDE